MLCGNIFRVVPMLIEPFTKLNTPPIEQRLDLFCRWIPVISKVIQIVESRPR